MTLFERNKLLVHAGKTVLVALVIFAVCWSVYSFSRQSKFTQQGVNGEAHVESSVFSDLPFEIDGVKYKAPILEVAGGETYDSLQASWEFGGDYAQIGSFPLDAESVFGSSSATPDDITSYSAAVIDSCLQEEIDEAPNTIDGVYYEPQDGTGNTSFVVWRSEILSNSIVANEDNWALQCASIEDGVLQNPVVLDTAFDLNQSECTPRIRGEVVPTFNDTSVYFSSNVLENGEWKCKVLEYDLTTNSRTIVDNGSFPAAIDNGLIYASDEVNNDFATGYTSISQYSDEIIEEIFHLRNTTDWNIAGIWACGGYRAVCVSPLSESHMAQGSYVGLWADDFSKPVCWLHIGSPTVVGSMNNEWFVWGSGSQGLNAEMYAFNWSTKQIIYLGSAIGYSRPAIARDSNVVLVPFAKDEFSALSYRVGILE